MAEATGQADAAVKSFREALSAWRQVDFPYEGAQTRVALARALRSAGQAAAADDELQAVQATFVQLGAMADARRPGAGALER